MRLKKDSRPVERTLAEPNDKGPAGLAQKMVANYTTVRIEKRNSKLATEKGKLKWFDWVELPCSHWADLRPAAQNYS